MNAQPTLAIEATGLVKSFGDTCAVDDVDLAVRSGAIYGVLGPNGAGKTTTIRMLATLIRPDAGRARPDQGRRDPHPAAPPPAGARAVAPQRALTGPYGH